MNIFQILWGIAWIIIGIVAGVSWIAFCFGSVLGIILILIFAPTLLFLPFSLSVYGLAILNEGLSRNRDKYNSQQQTNQKTYQKTTQQTTQQTYQQTNQYKPKSKWGDDE